MKFEKLQKLGRNATFCAVIGITIIAAGAGLPGSTAVGPPAARAQAHSAERTVDDEALRRSLAHYARVEPSVDRVVFAALATEGLSADRLESLATRARLSGLLPSIRIGARRGSGWDLSERTGEDGRVQLGTDDELALTGDAVFALDRLIFARDEVALLRETRAVQMVRRDLIRNVIRLYYERRRLILERDLLDVGGIEHALRIIEATALLDAFTGGRFREMMSSPDE